MSHNLQSRNQVGQFIENFDNQILFDVTSSDSSSNSNLYFSDRLDLSCNNGFLNPVSPIQIMAFNLNTF